VRQLAIGNDDFKDLRKENCYFVDKTYFIKDIIDTKAKVTLITRPRRFGKTLNISMLYYYFNCIENNKDLFDGLFISSQEDKYLNECGKYPAIFLTFKDIESLNYEDAAAAFKNVIKAEYRKRRFLLDSELLASDEKTMYLSVIEGKANIEDYKISLHFLSELLDRYYGQKAIILIDEYDKPLQTAFLNGYYKNFLAVFKGLFLSALKGNVHLHKAVLTGILRVAREGMFSTLNNLTVCGVTEYKYSNAFGFTQNEVDEMLKDFNLEDKLGEAAVWYNGYNYGGNIIYNPWSIINYCDSPKSGFEPYWVNSGSTEIIDLAVKNASNIRENLLELLNGTPVESALAKDMIYGDIENCIEKSVYTLLLYSGYLNIVGKDKHNRCIMKIPNKEIASAYKTMIERWTDNILNVASLVSMYEALFDGNLEPFKKYINDTFLRSFSYFDKNKDEPETVYQAFFMGLLTQLNSDLYSVKSNRESGLGRYDICVYPKAENKIKTGVIFEFKTTDNIDDLDKNAKAALSQINTRKYETDLKDYGVLKIIKLGIAFNKKRVAFLQSSEEI